METCCYLSFQLPQSLDEGEGGLHLKGGGKKVWNLLQVKDKEWCFKYCDYLKYSFHHISN